MVSHAIQAESFSFRGDLRRRAGVVITGCLENETSGVICELQSSVCVAAS